MSCKTYFRLAIIFLFGLTDIASHAQSLANGHTTVRLSELQAFNSGIVSTSTIASIRLIAKLSDNTALGYLRQAGDQTVKLTPEDSINGWLQAYIDKRFKGIFSSSGAHILWVLRNLSISEDSAAINTYIKLGAEVYSISNTKQLQLLQTIDTILTTSDTTDNHAAAIATAIQCLYNSSASTAKTPTTSLQAFNTTATSTNTSLSTDTVESQKLVQASWPIFKDSVYPTGIYASFDEFKNNNPSLKNPVIKIDSIDHHKILLCQLLPDSSAKEIPTAWGLSIRGELYCYKNGALIPIEKSKGAIVFSRYQEFATRKNQAIFYRSIIGPNNGDHNPFSGKHFYPASDKAVANLPNPPEATGIDLQTGDLSF